MHNVRFPCFSCTFWGYPYCISLQLQLVGKTVVDFSYISDTLFLSFFYSYKWKYCECIVLMEMGHFGPKFKGNLATYHC